MKLKASLSQFGLVLERHATIPGGEAKLFIAVIRQAYSDLLPYAKDSRLPKLDREAVRFFFDGRMDLFADSVGIDPEFVREMLHKCAPGIEAFVNLEEASGRPGSARHHTIASGTARPTTAL